MTTESRHMSEFGTLPGVLRVELLQVVRHLTFDQNDNVRRISELVHKAMGYQRRVDGGLIRELAYGHGRHVASSLLGSLADAIAPPEMPKAESVSREIED